MPSLSVWSDDGMLERLHGAKTDDERIVSDIIRLVDRRKHRILGTKPLDPFRCGSIPKGFRQMCVHRFDVDQPFLEVDEAGIIDQLRLSDSPA